MHHKLTPSISPQKHLAESYWRMRIEELGLACRISEAAGQADGVREAFDLLMLAPVSHGARLRPRLGEARIEAMLAAGACESAALAILPQGAGYMISQGANGDHLASVILPDSQREMTAGGSTTALALIAALMAELSELYPIGAQVSNSVN